MLTNGESAGGENFDAWTKLLIAMLVKVSYSFLKAIDTLK